MLDLRKANWPAVALPGTDQLWAIVESDKVVNVPGIIDA